LIIFFVSPTTHARETLYYILKSYPSEQHVILDDRIKEIDIPKEVEDIIKDKNLELEIVGSNHDEMYNIFDQI
jgi:hypothetical protein